MSRTPKIFGNTDNLKKCPVCNYQSEKDKIWKGICAVCGYTSIYYKEGVENGEIHDTN